MHSLPVSEPALAPPAGSVAVSDALLEERPAFFEAAGVGLSDGKDFGLPGFVRLNFGCPPARLEAALARIREAVAP